MDVPFNVTKYEEEKFSQDFERFKELFVKYHDEVKDVLEFARLWKKFTPNAYKYMND